MVRVVAYSVIGATVLSAASLAHALAIFGPPAPAQPSCVQQPSSSAQEQPPAPVPQLFRRVPLPFETNGTIWILDNGYIVVQVTLDRSHAEQREDGSRAAVMQRLGAKRELNAQRQRSRVRAVVADEQETFVLRLPPGVALVRRANGWSARASTETDESVGREIELSAAPLYEGARHSVLDIAGGVAVRFDPEKATWSVEAVDAATGERLQLSFSRADFDFMVQPAPPACEAHCANGDCWVSCRPPKLPVCWWDSNGDPHCECFQF